MQRKRFGSIHVFIIFLLALIGCTPPRARQPPPPTHAGAEVVVSCPDQATEELIKRHSLAWQNRQQAQVKVVRYAAEAGPDRGPAADVWVLPAADMPRWAAAGQLEAIPWDLISPDTSYDWKDLLP